jgi:hypothetical protein
VAGLDLAERLVRGMTSLLGIGGEESQQRVVCALEKGGEGKRGGSIHFLKLTKYLKSVQ